MSMQGTDDLTYMTAAEAAEAWGYESSHSVVWACSHEMLPCFKVPDIPNGRRFQWFLRQDFVISILKSLQLGTFRRQLNAARSAPPVPEPTITLAHGVERPDDV